MHIYMNEKTHEVEREQRDYMKGLEGREGKREIT